MPTVSKLWQRGLAVNIGLAMRIDIGIMSKINLQKFASSWHSIYGKAYYIYCVGFNAGKTVYYNTAENTPGVPLTVWGVNILVQIILIQILYENSVEFRPIIVWHQPANSYQLHSSRMIIHFLQKQIQRNI